MTTLTIAQVEAHHSACYQKLHSEYASLERRVRAALDREGFLLVNIDGYTEKTPRYLSAFSMTNFEFKDPATDYFFLLAVELLTCVQDGKDLSHELSVSLTDSRITQRVGSLDIGIQVTEPLANVIGPLSKRQLKPLVNWLRGPLVVNEVHLSGQYTRN